MKTATSAQGDGNKAIFCTIPPTACHTSTAHQILAETKVRIGKADRCPPGGRSHRGIGPCRRPLCCSSWMTNFVSVATSAARYRDIAQSPELAGQCAKLKCCLNFEVDTYVEASPRCYSRVGCKARPCRCYVFPLQERHLQPPGYLFDRQKYGCEPRYDTSHRGFSR